MRIAALEEGKLARTGQEYLDLIASDADWIVRTPEDLMQLRSIGEGALSKLSSYDFDAFASSLLFAGGAVASGSYKPLMSSLTLTDIFEIFARFGMNRDYVVRILEAKCVDGDWDFAFWRFCASNCVHMKKG